MKFAKILRAARAATSYAKFHKWEPGMLDVESNPQRPFKPGYVGSEAQAEADIDIDEQWGGDLGDWAHALKEAREGIRIDFYITDIRPGGELVTNVGVKIISETEALVCETCGRPFTVKLGT